MDPRSEEARIGRGRLAPAAMLVAVGLILSPSLLNAGFILDDTVNLARHAHHGDLLGEWTTATYTHADPTHSGHVWRPIPATMEHALALAVGRDSVVPFRLLTLGFHLANVALVFGFARCRGVSAGLASVAGLVAGIHAVPLESACWASCLFDVSMTTVILGLLMALPSFATPAAVALSLSAGVVATLCKETAVAASVVVAAVSFADLGVRRSLACGVPFLLGSAGVLLAHDAVVGSSYVDTVGSGSLSAFAGAFLQISATAVPLPGVAPLAHLYDATDLPLSLAGLAICSTIAWIVLRSSAGPARRYALAGAVALLAPLVPAAVATVATQTLSVRLVYAGWILAVACAAVAWRAEAARRPVVAVLLVALVLAGFPRTFTRPWALRSERSLFGSELAFEPGSPWAKVRAGRLGWKESRERGSLRMWWEGITSAPAGLVFVDPPEEWWGYAQAAFLSNQPRLAIEALDRLDAASLAAGVPLPPLAPCLRADVLDKLGRPAEAAQAALRCPNPAGSAP